MTEVSEWEPWKLCPDIHGYLNAYIWILKYISRDLHFHLNNAGEREWQYSQHFYINFKEHQKRKT